MESESRGRPPGKDPRLSTEKYYDIVGNIRRAVSEINLLGISNGHQSCRILDVGTGFGYFPLICGEICYDVAAKDKTKKPTFKYARQKLAVEIVE